MRRKSLSALPSRLPVQTAELAKAWGWCIPALSLSSFGVLKVGLPNPARLLGSRQTSEEVTAGIGGSLGPSFRAERRWCALWRRNAHAGLQCSRCIDSRVDPGIQRTEANSVERPNKSGAGVCVVGHIERHQSDHPQVGVESTLPNRMFWYVAFPPKDRIACHPDAKSRVKRANQAEILRSPPGIQNNELRCAGKVRANEFAWIRLDVISSQKEQSATCCSWCVFWAALGGPWPNARQVDSRLTSALASTVMPGESAESIWVHVRVHSDVFLAWANTRGGPKPAPSKQHRLMEC